ncbi:MAG: DNA polymerase III subunit gamma/tau [Chloroflexi bacterium]|nr:MAG: DNA polymerase III subunit gamma/tau [Chloroflexota bacterium]
MPKPAAVEPLVPPEDSQPLVDDPSHRALYRRWRAQRFGELIGQDPIVTTLRNAVATDRIAHAYLFVGPRGTGKTSTARILAKAINCTDREPDGEPCDRCAACVSVREGRAMDVIEIDAASHGLVEDARDLVMRALTAPAELRRRVYIIDEVHMLSAHAFNALLKLVEEPPPHVVFVLATTDTHKVPATIISRTQRFDFHRLSEEDALALIARLADGAMRDGESLLDQVLAYAGEQVTLEAVREAVGLADEATIVALVDAFVAGDAPAALDRIEALVDLGREMGQIAEQCEEETRRRLLHAAGDPTLARRLASILRTLAEAATVGAREGRARLALELLAVEGLAAGEPLSAPRPLAVSDATPLPMPRAAAPEPAIPQPLNPQPSDPQPAAAALAPDAAALRARWPAVIERAGPAIKPLLAACRPVAIDGARVTLAFPEERGFMREKVANRSAAIEQLLGSVLGGQWAIECIVSNVELEPLTVAQALTADPADPDGRALLEGVLRITGGELLDVPEVR